MCQCWRRCVGCCVLKNEMFRDISPKAISVIVLTLRCRGFLSITVINYCKNQFCSYNKYRNKTTDLLNFESIKNETVKSVIIPGRMVSLE